MGIVLVSICLFKLHVHRVCVIFRSWSRHGDAISCWKIMPTQVKKEDGQHTSNKIKGNWKSSFSSIVARISGKYPDQSCILFTVTV